MSVTIAAPGLLTTIQDRGRFGHAALGVGTAGAMDDVALRLANALVGNDADAAALELTLRGPRLRFEADTLIALTGAEFEPRCNGRPLPLWRPVLVRAGAEIDCGGARRGVRAYLALAGGIDVARVLGSRSMDVNAAIGPFGGVPLRAGDRMPSAAAQAASAAPLLRALGASAPAGRDAAQEFVAASWSVDPEPWFEAGSPALIAVIRGAHCDRLDPASQAALFSAPFRIEADSNRVGYRLDGPRLALAEPLELVSAGVVPGTMQLPPGGKAIVLMVEAPTTGGYPRIGHVASVDLPRLAQCRPGDHVRFGACSLDEAQTRYLERERALRALVLSIRGRLSG